MRMTATEVLEHQRKHGFRDPLTKPDSIPTPALLMVTSPDRIDFFMEFEPPEATAQQKGVRMVIPKDPSKRPFVQHFKHKRIELAEQEIGRRLVPFRPAHPMEGPLLLVTEWTWKWRTSEPKKARAAGWKWRDTQPDFDNISKMLVDQMAALGFFHNDAQIADARVTKQWGDRPGIRITLAQLQQP